MSIKQILLASTGGGGTPPPTPDGTYYLNGSQFGWAFVGPDQNKPTYDGGFQFPDGGTNQTWTFYGNEYMSTAETSGTPTAVYLNLWFYPTYNGCILMTNQNTLQESLSYHCSVLEITGNGSVVGRFWPNGGITTSERVSLNAWNHVYLAHDGTQTILRLNNGTENTATNSWDKPNPIVFSPGGFSVTNTGWGVRYQGKIADFYVNYDTTPGSNYDSTKSKYQARPLLYVDANNINSTIPASVVAGAPSLGYAGPTNLFLPGDFTTGSGTSVQAGWTVSGSGGWTANVTAMTPNWSGIGGSIGITVDQGGWGSSPYAFRDPAATASTTVWTDISGNSRNITLYNNPAFNDTGIKCYNFDPSNLQYGDAATLGNQSYWTVELWITTTASLNTTNATSPISTVFDDPATLESPGVINFTISNNFNSPGYTGLKAGFFDGGWRETGAFVPSPGQWLHVVGTYDGAVLKTYLNGARDGVYGYQGVPTANSGKVRIARRWDGLLTATNMFPGKIGLVRIYSSALNDVEVLAHYNDTKSYYGL